MSAWPSRSFATSAADGFWTRSTTSAWLYSSVRRDDRRTGVGVGRIGERGTGAGAGLDEDLEARLGELADDFGHECDAPLVGR